jgi:hypothetical protein
METVPMLRLKMQQDYYNSNQQSSGVNHSNPGLILTRHLIPCSAKRAGATMDTDPMCRIFFFIILQATFEVNLSSSSIHCLAHPPPDVQIVSYFN